MGSCAIEDNNLASIKEISVFRSKSKDDDKNNLENVCLGEIGLIRIVALVESVEHRNYLKTVRPPNTIECIIYI